MRPGFDSDYSDDPKSVSNKQINKQMSTTDKHINKNVNKTFRCT